MTQEIKIKKKQDTTKLTIYASAATGVFLVLFGVAISAIFKSSLSIVFLVMGVVVAIVPASAIKYSKYHKYRKMEDHFPTFLKDFSEAIKSGMNFVQAFKIVSKSDYGPLSDELIHASNQLSWGVPFPKVLMQLASRIRSSKIMRQSFTIIIEAYTSGGDIAETMDSIAMNISSIREVNEERKSILSQQVYIMYFIYFLFLGIIVALYKLMIPLLAINVSAADSGFSGMSLGGAVNYCDTMPWLCNLGVVMGYDPSDPLTYFRVLFLMMVLIQGVASGVIAGELSEGNATAGIKHAGIMIVSSLLVFIMFIT